MKNLDTATVLAIIEMINNRIEEIKMDAENEHIDVIQAYDKFTELDKLGHYLQSFIEGELNKAEQ